MKIKLMCPQCLEESYARIDVGVNVPKTELDFFLPAEVTSDGIFEVCCKAGHKNLCVLSNPNFDILFDIGYSAYKDGYYREACLDFAASYERFHEYCIFTMLCQENDDAMDDLENMWKLISRQSERQYGAFVVLYTNAVGKAPIELSRKWREFRNDITHKGIIPTSDETLQYAKAIGAYIVEINRCLENKIEMWKGMYPKLHKVLKKDRGIENMNTILPTILSSLYRGDTFEKAIAAFDKGYPYYMYEK